MRWKKYSIFSRYSLALAKLRKRTDIALMLFSQRIWNWLLARSSRIRLDRLLDSVYLFFRLPHHLIKLGPRAGIHFWAHSLFIDGLARIKVPGYPQAFTIRGRTSDSVVFDSIFVKECYKAVRKLLNPKWILDAGAYTGFSSAYFAHHFPQADVIALEPEKTNFTLLKSNTKSYKNIFRIEKALWSHDGRLAIDMYHNQSEGDYWGYTVSEPSAAGQVEVRATTLSTLCREYGVTSWDIIKIDIEGAESEICNEEFSAIFANSRMLYIELHEHLFPGSSENAFRVLSNVPCKVRLAGENLLAIPFKPKSA